MWINLSFCFCCRDATTTAIVMVVQRYYSGNGIFTCCCLFHSTAEVGCAGLVQATSQSSVTVLALHFSLVVYWSLLGGRGSRGRSMKAIQDNPLSVQNPFLPVEVPYFVVDVNGEADPDGFTSCSAPHHSRSSVPYIMMDGNGKVDPDGFTRCSVPHHARSRVPYFAMGGKFGPVCGGCRPGRGQKYGAQGLIAAICTRWSAVNRSDVGAQGFLFCAPLPSRAVFAAACCKRPLMRSLTHQRHLFLRQRHRCLRRARHRHHLRFHRQRHQFSRRVRCLHHPMCPFPIQSGAIQNNWCIFLVHAGCCRRPGRDRNTGLPIRWCFWPPSRAGYKYGAGFARQRQPSCSRRCPLSQCPTPSSYFPVGLSPGGTGRMGGNVRILFNLGGTGRLRGTGISYFTVNFSTIGAGATFFRFFIFRGGAGWTYLLVDFSVGVCGSGRNVAKSCIGRARRSDWRFV